MVTEGIHALTFLPGTGYGDAGALYVKGLHALGVPISWTPLVPGSQRWGRTFGIAPIAGEGLGSWRDDIEDETLQRLFNRPLAGGTLLVQLPYDWWSKALEMYPGYRPVAYIAWETDRLPAGWADVLNRFERVIVPSQFNAQVCAASGVRIPIDVVPHGARVVTPVLGGAFGRIAPEDFVFYTIGEWRTRKALSETIRAYLEEFSADDNVALIVKTSARDHEAHETVRRRLIENPPTPYTRTWWTVARILSEYRRPAKVHLMFGRLPQKEIDQLHTRGDCFVSLTHGEGWGLGSFDAALFDNPSIMTGWSGHLDYLSADNPLLVNFTLVEASQCTPEGRVIEPNIGQRWAAPDRAHARRLMRWAFEHPTDVRALGAAMGRRIREEYESSSICRRLAGRLGFDD
jgi:hypothetical protein